MRRARRNRNVVAGILGHRIKNVRMRREERAESRIFLRIRVVIDQRTLLGECTRCSEYRAAKAFQVLSFNFGNQVKRKFSAYSTPSYSFVPIDGDFRFFRVGSRHILGDER
jgi:hypothetical protein